MNPEKLISHADAAKVLGMTPGQFQAQVDKCSGPVWIQIAPRKLVQLNRGSLTIRPWKAKGSA